MNVAVDGRSDQIKNYNEVILCSHPLLTLNDKGQPILGFKRFPMIGNMLNQEWDGEDVGLDVYEQAVKNSFDAGTTLDALHISMEYADFATGMLIDTIDFYGSLKNREFKPLPTIFDQMGYMNKIIELKKTKDALGCFVDAILSLEQSLCISCQSEYRLYDGREDGEFYCESCLREDADFWATRNGL